jgi:hypothetical protein
MDLFGGEIERLDCAKDLNLLRDLMRLDVWDNGIIVPTRLLRTGAAIPKEVSWVKYVVLLSRLLDRFVQRLGTVRRIFACGKGDC